MKIVDFFKKKDNEDNNINILDVKKEEKYDIDDLTRKFILQQEKFENLKYEITNTKSYEIFERHLYDTYWIKDKLIKLDKIVPKNTKLKSNIKEVLKNIEEVISYLKEKSNIKEEIKEEKIIEVEKINKKFKEVKKYEITSKEKQLINSSINRDLEDLKIEYDKVNKLSDSKSVTKEDVKLLIIDKFEKETIKMYKNRYPMSLFTNEDVGNLVIYILLNNRIRLLHKMTSNSRSKMSYIKYENIEKQINNYEGYLGFLKNIFNNSILQLEKMIMEVSYDYNKSKIISSILKDLNELKDNLELENNKLEKEISLYK